MFFRSGSGFQLQFILQKCFPFQTNVILDETDKLFDNNYFAKTNFFGRKFSLKYCPPAKGTKRQADLFSLSECGPEL
jgi:hypothetical protein